MKFISSLGIESPVFQLQIFGIILFVQDSIFSLPFVSLLFLATRAELLVVKYRHKSRDKESPTKRKKVEHRCLSNSAALTFLDAFSHLYKRVCPSVGRSVGPSVRPSVRHKRVEFLIFRLK